MSTTGTATPTLIEAMRALANRELSADELTRMMLDRIRQTGPVLHAWVQVDEDDALVTAMGADRRRQLSRNPPPLLGIPVGIKDIFDIAGRPTRCNSRLRDDVPVAVYDSRPVHAMRRAGATLLGKTVTQEFAAGVISAPARNPWDPDRIPGGSSGGSAVAVASGSALGALGSDTGGSVRIPASVTGTVGLKPTFGRLPLQGTFPLSPSLDTVGPITRTVADAAIMYLALAHRLQEIPEVMAELSGDVPDQPLAGKRIGVLTSFFNKRVQPDVTAAISEATGQMRALGADIVECDWQDARAARAAAMLISRVESAAVHRDALRDHPDLFGDDVRYRFEVGAMLTGDDYIRARLARESVKRSIAELYHGHGLSALMVPTLPATAPLAEVPLTRFDDGSEEGPGAALTRFTMPWNATGQPVISVPCGFDTNGMPIGCSFVGWPDEELELCRIAHVYEQTTGWYRRRPDPVSPVTTRETS